MDMVERVARAIDPECFEEYYLKLYGPKITADNQKAATGLARAAIEAMREPTDEMIDAGVDARRAIYDRMEAKGLDTKTVLVANHPAGTIYAAMIDAALVPSPPLREE